MASEAAAAAQAPQQMEEKLLRSAEIIEDAPMLDSCPIQWTGLPPEVRNSVLQNLGERDLAEYAMTSRQCRDDAGWSNLSQRRTAVIQCSDRHLSTDSQLFGLGMHPLVGALLKIPTTKSSSHGNSQVFQDRFTCIQLEGASRLPKINNREARPILRSLSLPGVTHLDLSSSPNNTHVTVHYNHHHKAPHVAPSIVRLWTQVLPSLMDLDLSYNLVSTATLADIARNGHALTTLRIVGGCLASSSVTLVDFHKSGSSSSTGAQQPKQETLRFLYLQNCCVAATQQEEDDVFEDEYRPDACPFSHVVGDLERMSLTGCRYYDIKKEKENALQMMQVGNNNNLAESNALRGKPFTQLSLMKIVRKATNLKWFQSDLTELNVAIMKEERPDVTFVR